MNITRTYSLARRALNLAGRSREVAVRLSEADTMSLDELVSNLNALTHDGDAAGSFINALLRESGTTFQDVIIKMATGPADPDEALADLIREFPKLAGVDQSIQDWELFVDHGLSGSPAAVPAPLLPIFMAAYNKALEMKAEFDANIRPSAGDPFARDSSGYYGAVSPTVTLTAEFRARAAEFAGILAGF